MIKQITLLFLVGITSYGQDILWERSYGGRHADYLFDVQPTADYGFILAGSSLSKQSGNKTGAGNGDLDYWIWKMNENGELDWQKSFGGSGSDMLKSLQLTGDGGFILGGTSNSPASEDATAAGAKLEGCRGGNDYWVIKLDAKGQVEWQKTFGGVGQDDLVSVAPTRDGGYIVGGSSASDPVPLRYGENDGATPPYGHPSKGGEFLQGMKSEKSRGNMDYWILKLDSDGNVEWQKSYGGDYADLLRTVAPTFDGGYILGGYSNLGQSGDKDNVNFGEGGDYWLLKLDKKGAIEWQQTLGGDQDDELFAVLPTEDKGYLIGGSSNSGITNSKYKSNKNGSDFWLIKLQEDGQMDWQETYDFGEVDLLTSIVANDDGTYLVGGYSPLTNGEENQQSEGINDFIALKISENGERLWDKSVGSEGQDILKKTIVTRDGGYLMAGMSNPERSDYSFSGKQADTKNPISVGNGVSIAALDKAQQAVDGRLQEASQKANRYVTNAMDSATQKAKTAIGQDADSRLQLGVNKPTGDLMQVANSGSTDLADAATKALSGGNQQANLPVSRDKTKNYGSTDFWVVKLKDKSKKVQTRSKIEAFPNPTQQFTNIIVGFEYEKGTLAVYNLAGNELQRFEITDRTIPVDLGRYPEGIYIITVATDKGEASMKVIKGISKN